MSGSLKLLMVAGFLVLILLVLAVLNERTLPLFGGDRDRAARFMLTVFSLLGGLAFALAQPAFWIALANLIQKRVAQGGKTSGAAQWILRPELRDTARAAGVLLMAVFAMAAVVIAALQWTGRA